LDYWPLNRLASFTPQVLLQRVAEKIPLFVLTVGSCVATALVPEKLTAADKLPFGLRLENAVVSCVTYLWQMIHPSGLACVYPNPTNYLPFWQVAGALGLLLAISGAAWAFRRTHPWLVVGWLWYLGMMIPVIGMVQISYYAHADRYTYLPQIGLYLMLTWTAADLCAGWRHRRVLLGGLSTVILVALIFCAHTQTLYWRNSEVLWAHTLVCTSDNYIAHYNLGDALIKKRRMDEAITHFQTALQIKPDYAEAHDNLGNALFQKGRVDEAITHYQTALQIRPDNAKAHNNLAIALFQKGRVNEAITHYQTALQIKPDYAEAHNNLGNALFQKGRVDEAITHYQTALQIKPDYAEAHNNLAWVLATVSQASLRNGGKAVKLAERANQLTSGENPVILRTLAAAYAEAGRLGDALLSAQKAIELAQAAGQKNLVEQINGELKFYERGLPFHQESK
jgi:tetratricopeptide (TPR) repeat protein